MLRLHLARKTVMILRSSCISAKRSG